MALIRRSIVLAGGLAGALAASQGPEFAQQYQQRLGGALDELTEVVADFDRDATDNGLSRTEALERYAANEDRFFRDRGESMARVIARYETLWTQALRFHRTPPALRPLVLVRGSDDTVLSGAWQAYEPAIPVTSNGIMWAAAGFVLAAFPVWLLARMPRALRRRRRGYS